MDERFCPDCGTVHSLEVVICCLCERPLENPLPGEEYTLCLVCLGDKIEMT